MKKINSLKFMYLFYLLVSTQISFSQENPYLNTYECSNHNAFLAGDSIETLKYYTDTIYPSGIMDMDISKSGEYDGIENLFPLLAIDQGSTFELVKVSPSRFDNDKKYYKYQQYHQGIKVEGGGYIVSALIYGDPGDPCEMDFLMAPHIASGINVNVSPTFDSTTLDTILANETGIRSELLITLNLLNDCQYHLAWKVHYVDGDSKISWVDAHTGLILKTSEGYANLNAPTQIYGTRNLDDSSVAGSQSLISTDGRISTYDFEDGICPVSRSGWNVNLIPSTMDTIWTTSQASASVYQGHYATTEVISVFDDLGINFVSVNVAICDNLNVGAAFDPGNNSLKAALKFGKSPNGMSYAIFDVLSHELGHVFLYDYLDYNKLGNKTIHEGIADMIGTYVESIIQGNIDWVMGDDVADIASKIDRDLENPEYDCLNDNVPDQEHTRSAPLGHWFYLISEGDGPTHPALGIEKAILIVLESLNLMGPNSDYEEMKDATISFVDEEYGYCSIESRAIRAAWNRICIETELCPFFYILGVNPVCEEHDYLQLCVSGGSPSATFNWQYPSGWTVQGGTPGGGFNGVCLTVTDFPKYNWYPQYFQVKSTWIGSGLHVTKTIKLNDCLSDDPTCEEYYALQGGGSTDDRYSVWENLRNNVVKSELCTIKVFDISGRLIYQGAPLDFNTIFIPYQGLYIFSYFDESSLHIKTEKRILLK